jgi:4-hydroxybenzoate polyprenyltransferase
MFLTSFGYEGLKDVRDIAGDQAIGTPLTWIQRRPRLGRRVSLLAVMLGAVVLVGPSFAGCGWVYTITAGAAMLVAAATWFVPARWSLMMVYGECVLVGIAATADFVVVGPEGVPWI